MRGYEVPDRVLIHWYECGRKVQFADEEEARRLRPWQQHFYLCPHADDGHWHTGRDGVRRRMNNAKSRYRLKKNARREWDNMAYRSAEWANQRWHQDITE
jgi:hypothetical protein